jgi:hypothetical protein
MAPKVNGALAHTEVNRVDREVNKVDPRLDVPFRQAKARFGAAVGEAIHPHPLKAFGDKGQLSKVIGGDVPEYLARIVDDPNACRRFARALLANDSTVRVRTVIEWDEEEAV